MCMSKGVPKKPAYGPCRERHGGVNPTYYPPTGSSYYNNSTAGTSSYTWANATTATSTANWNTP